MTRLPAESYCAHAAGHPVHGPYHDEEYGFPVEDDRLLFERLCLEMNQAGLSWLTILRKKEAFRAAYDGFDPVAVASYGPDDRARLLSDAGIVRNRLKIDAAIHNAGRLLQLREEHGSFAGWLDHHQVVEEDGRTRPRDRNEWVKLFKKTFRFTGGEITNEFLVSTGYLPGAHHPACPVFPRVVRQRPPWMRAGLGA